MYIIFEGGEGSGKTTQIKLLQKSLNKIGKETIIIREPGGTPVGQEIREILLNKLQLKMNGTTEALLFSAARSQLTTDVVIPALNEGKIVVADRSFYSTLAYQGYARGNDIDALRKLTEFAIGNTKPSLVILLDIQPKEGLDRKTHKKK